MRSLLLGLANLKAVFFADHFVRACMEGGADRFSWVRDSQSDLKLSLKFLHVETIYVVLPALALL